MSSAGLGSIAAKQRVLSVVVMPRGMSCAHEVVERDGHAPLRLEVRLDTSFDQLLDMFGRALGLLVSYEALRDPGKCRCFSERFEKLALSRPIRPDLAELAEQVKRQISAFIDAAARPAAEASFATAQMMPDPQPGTPGEASN